MRVGILGGSFNPPHIGHLHISNLAIKKLKLNQVWWIPCAYNQFKDKKIYESYEARLDKCLAITKDHKKIYIKNFSEIHTAKLLSNLKKRFKTIDFFWIMGADNLDNLHEWTYFKKLISLANFVVFSREDFLKNINNKKSFILIRKKSYKKIKVFRTKKINISSTKIRNKNFSENLLE